MGNEAKDEPSKDFLTANGTGTGRGALKPASYLIDDDDGNDDDDMWFVSKMPK